MKKAAKAEKASAKAIMRKSPELADEIKKVESVVDAAVKRLQVAKTRLKQAKKAYKQAKKAARKAKKVQRRWLAHIKKTEADQSTSMSQGKSVAVKKAARKPKTAAKAAGPRNRSANSTETVTPPVGSMS